MADNRRFTIARKEKQNADLVKKQNQARMFLSSTLNEDIEEEDMSVALQDGVLLCKLINHFKPDSIKKYNMNPRIPFKMMENAGFVIDFCKKNDIPVTFKADNICNKENLILIVEFVLNIAAKMGWVPPEIQAAPSILENGSVAAPAIPQATPVSPQAAPVSLHATPISPPTSPPTTFQKPASATTLKSVMDEIIASEKDFLQDMETFAKLYVAPSKTILPVDKANAIFGNIDNVIAANNKFLLELLLVQDGFMSISTVWYNFSSAINIYSVYGIFQQNSYSVLEQCRKEFPAFDAHLKSVEYSLESKKGNTFGFLMKPFARVVKYNSVLKQFLQCLPPGTEDYDCLVDVKKQFQDLTDASSDIWKKVENSRKIAEIAAKLMGSEKAGLRKLGRIYLREGDFTVNSKPAKLFLFSDIIVYAVPVSKAILGGKKSTKSHIFKGIISLNACTFQDLPDGKEGKNALEIATSDKLYKIHASSASEKRLWVTDINKCIARVTHHAREHPENPSSTESRPMLEVRKVVPTRFDSQNQTTLEEKRKTVKLSFGSTNEDDDEELHEEVQLSMPGGNTNEEKRKTVKLEFGAHQQRQLSVRDRSQTVELAFKPSTDTGNDDADEEEAQEAKQTIVDKRKTVKLAFKPRSVVSPSDSESIDAGQDASTSLSPDAEAMSEGNRDEERTEESSELAESAELLEDKGSEYGNETQNQDISDSRDDYYASDHSSDDGQLRPSVSETNISSEITEQLGSEEQVQQTNGEAIEQTHEQVEARDVEQGEESHGEQEVQAEPNVAIAHESHSNDDPNTVERAIHEYATDEQATEQTTDELSNHKQANEERAAPEQHNHGHSDHDATYELGSRKITTHEEVMPQQHTSHHHVEVEHTKHKEASHETSARKVVKHEHEPHDREVHEHTATQLKHSQEVTNNFAPPPAKETKAKQQAIVHGGHDEHSNLHEPSETATYAQEAVVVALQSEVHHLKEELSETRAQLLKYIEEHEKEKEEGKVWKARVERILSVLLDAMKQSNSSRNG